VGNPREQRTRRASVKWPHRQKVESNQKERSGPRKKTIPTKEKPPRTERRGAEGDRLPYDGGKNFQHWIVSRRTKKTHGIQLSQRKTDAKIKDQRG